MNRKIYLFSGKARAGKNVACEYYSKLLQDANKNVLHTLYAKYLKQYAKDYFGWDGREETKPRELLQTLGTDIIRKELNKPDFHVNRICEDIEILSKYFNRFLISDCRFPNEILIPKQKFGNDVIAIRIVRTNFVSDLTPIQQQHESETALDDFTGFDYVIMASNLNELYEQLNIIYEAEERDE
jgi:hypothetical protein